MPFSLRRLPGRCCGWPPAFALSSLYVGAESWIHDRVANAQRGRVFSIYMVVQMIGLTAAQFLLSVGDPKSAAPFLLAAVLFLIGAVPVVVARHTAPRGAPPEPLHIGNLFRVSPLGASVTVIAGVSWSIVFTFGPVYAQKSGFDLQAVSLFMAAAMIGGAVVQFPMGWLSDAIGRRRTIAAMSAGGIAVSLFGLWADGQSDLMRFAASLLTGGIIFPMYAISAAHTNDAIAPQNRVAAAAGLILLFGLGSIFGPLLSGGAVTALGTGGYYIVLAVASASAWRRRRPLDDAIVWSEFPGSSSPASCGRSNFRLRRKMGCPDKPGNDRLRVARKHVRQARRRPIPAATILLLRDGVPGLEVFMVKRHHQIDFVAGALVFPGGKLEKGDSDPALDEHIDCAGDWTAPMRALGAGAIREAFEESGILLARDARTGELVPAARLEELQPYRHLLEKREAVLAEVAGEGEAAPRARPSRALRALDHAGQHAAALRHAFLPGRLAGRPCRQP